MSYNTYFDAFVEGFLIGSVYYGVKWIMKKIRDQNGEIEEILSELEDCKEQLSSLKDCKENHELKE